jgi:hypothetical protein
MVLSFAAYRQTLDQSLTVGTRIHADVFHYPGAAALRVLLGPRHSDPQPAGVPVAGTVAEACAAVGAFVAREPWIDRVPVALVATPARAAGRWLLTDHTGSLPVVEGTGSIPTLLACSAGTLVTITAEWTPAGLVPLTVHLRDRTVDVGPVADPSFVGAA